MGSGPGGGEVKLLDPATGATALDLFPFGKAFTGGVSVATGDFNGDGIPDVVVGAGAGGGPAVGVYDGKTGAELRSFFAFDPSFTGGVNVAVGYVTNGASPDIVVGAGRGGGPVVEVFTGASTAPARSFLAYEASFSGGVNVAVGDVNGDGYADIITGAGAGSGPRVEVFSGADGGLMRNFFAYAPSYTGGVYVAAGEVTGRYGFADIITGAAADAPHVEVFDGTTGAVLQSFFAYSGTGGVRVASADVSGSAGDEVITGTGPEGGSKVAVFDGAAGEQLITFATFGPPDTDVSVAASSHLYMATTPPPQEVP